MSIIKKIKCFLGLHKWVDVDVIDLDDGAKKKGTYYFYCKNCNIFSHVLARRLLPIEFVDFENTKIILYKFGIYFDLEGKSLT